MNAALVSLIAAGITLVGTHFALSHPLRTPLIGRLGERGFMLIYSVVALAAMVWMADAFGKVPPETVFWAGYGDTAWIAGSALTLVAAILFVGSLAGNPALPAPGAEAAARQEPRGVFRVTRHPMMWGFALWALAHAIAAPTSRTLVVAATIATLALVGAHLQDRKKAALMGEAWREWAARTSYWPRLTALPQARWFALLGGTALWLAATYAHLHAGGGAAGPWRWLG